MGKSCCRKLTLELAIVQLDFGRLSRHGFPLMVHIRQYQASDAPALIVLIRELQANEVALYERMKPAADMGEWYIELLKKQCAEDDGAILIAEEDGKVLGYAVVLTKLGRRRQGRRSLL